MSAHQFIKTLEELSEKAAPGISQGRIKSIRHYPAIYGTMVSVATNRRQTMHTARSAIKKARG